MQIKIKEFANALQDRLIRFSTEIIQLSIRLPEDKVGQYFSNQIMRSGISPSVNYAEACSAEYSSDFIHKMKVCLKELRETQVCLKLIHININADTLKIQNEEDELISIFVRSIRTALNNKTTNRKL